MKKYVDYGKRQVRLDGISRLLPDSENHQLVSMLPLTAVLRSRIRTAMNFFLWECLSHNIPDNPIKLTDDMLADYTDQVIALPNITPNGLILPKRENQLGFNLVQQYSIAAFDSLGLGEHINRVQWPVNIRLQSGTPNLQIDSRPRASVKPHSDIWAGDPASGLMSFLSVLGDSTAAGIDFLLPESFPLDMVRPLDDYDEGAKMASNAQKIAQFDDRGWYIVDPYLLHRTTKNKPGYRISIDFRFIANEVIESDKDEDESRKDWFISYDKWRQIGRETMVIAGEGMDDFKVDKTVKFTTGYPTQIRLSNS